MPPPCWPAACDDIEELGIPRALMVDLMLRHIRQDGAATLTLLSRALRVSVGVVESLFHQLRQQQLLDVEGMVGNDYSFRLTSRGREQVTERSELGSYVGPTPVSLEEYCRVTRNQAARLRVSRDRLREALSDLVVSDGLLDQLGPALISHRSIFIYGPTGNGKTSLAERLVRLYEDSVVLPYAVLVGGYVVTLFDPVVHQRLEIEDESRDARWVPCRRPCLLVGGELTYAMLELRLDEVTGVYAAPLQMKANNGILVIDDFGRQVISPRDLLNRWIVPLDRRVDYLSLGHGIKFQLPFELLVVFSTNLDPHELADEAFLRRIHTKVYVDAVTPEAFDGIFQAVAERRGIPFNEGTAEHMRRLCLTAGSALRACYPADLCDVMTSICAYEERPARITHAEIDRAAQLYFTRTR